jgi:hypothetical protein
VTYRLRTSGVGGAGVSPAILVRVPQCKTAGGKSALLDLNFNGRGFRVTGGIVDRERVGRGFVR